MPKKARIITIANQKGGIGKTTTAMCLATILNRKGYKTLLIDTDMQCNATDAYGAQVEDTPTIYDVILAAEADRIPIMDTIQHTESGDIIASDRLLTGADSDLQKDPEGVFRLQDALAGISGYDYIVIDTNPTLNFMLYNALVTTDELIIPVTSDRFGFTGLNQLNETIQKIKRRQNPSLKVMGLLLIKFKKSTRLGKDVKEILDKTAVDMDTSLFENTIRESVKVQEAQIMRTPLIEYAPNCTSAIDYEDFVDELLEREGR